jgi:hypothetical protein
MSPTIKILSRKEIDTSKWNDCVAKCSNSLVYAYTNYLDALAINWQGLIINNYKAVMPLPYKKKWGISYLYQPPFTQQLGLFGDISDTRLEDIFNAIHSFTKYGDVFFNFQNGFVNMMLPVQQLTNYTINLQQDYIAINNHYKKDLRNNLKKAEKENLKYIVDENTNEAITIFQTYYASRTPHVTAKDYNNFKRLCQGLQENKQCLVRKVVDKQNSLLAIVLLLKDANRLYNIMNTTTEAGRKTEANHFLLDAIISEFEGEDLIFDFEGSDLPGVKIFYEKFGVTNQPYFHYHFNHLPFPLRLFKK